MLMAMATRNAAGIAMPQISLALKQAAKKLQAEHQLSQANRFLDSRCWWRHQERILAQMLETPSLEDMISDFIEPARELDLLDEEEWDEELMLGDDPISYEEDSALVADLFRQATQPATAESPIVPAELDQLPEVTSSNTKLPPLPNLIASPRS